MCSHVHHKILTEYNCIAKEHNIAWKTYTEVCIMIDRLDKIVECDFPSPLAGFDGFEYADYVNGDEPIVHANE